MLTKLNSMSNKNFRLHFESEAGPDCIIRINDQNNDLLLSRENEEQNSLAAYKASIAVKCGFTKHYKFSEYLPGRHLCAKEASDIDIFLQSLAKLHSLSEREYANYLQPFELARNYSKKYIDLLTKMETELSFLLEHEQQEKVPVHGDLVAENILIYEQKAYLIDFEYSGIFYREWDLADFVCENKLSKDEEEALLLKYVQISTRKISRVLFYYFKCLTTLLWIHWTDYYKHNRRCFHAESAYKKYLQEKIADFNAFSGDYQWQTMKKPQI